TGCLAVAPRVPLVTQCCGLAGIGEFLLDLASVTDDIRYRQDAINILNLMLIRSGGSPTTPCFPHTSMATSTPGWATGASGVLSFLRRLVDPSSFRLWMADSIVSQVEKLNSGASNPTRSGFPIMGAHNRRAHSGLLHHSRVNQFA